LNSIKRFDYNAHSKNSDGSQLEFCVNPAYLFENRITLTAVFCPRSHSYR